MTKQKKTVIAVLAVILFVCEIIGLVLSFYNQMVIQGHPAYYVFKAYTQDSNILSMFSALALLIAAVKAIKNGTDISRKALLARYVTTCLTTVTFLIVVVVLMPNKNPEVGGFINNFFKGSLFFYHGFCPLLALAMFLFIEGKHYLKVSHIFLALLPTFLYAAIWISLVAFNIVPDEDAPYPFLRVHQQSIGTSVMWFCVIIGVAAVVAAVLYYIGRKKKGQE